MPKVEVYPQSWGRRVCFHCPGCKGDHCVHVRDDGQGWTFNGDVDRPTITPSILVNRGGANPDVPVCHSHVKEGFIQFLADSGHALAGQSVLLAEIDDGPCPDGEHRWVGRQMGGPPDAAESHEWVEYCDVCGIERPGDD